jgi:hypothetical protein
MMTAPVSRAAARGSERAAHARLHRRRRLALAGDIADRAPRGRRSTPLPTPQLYQLVARLHGPSVHIPSLERAVGGAAALLNAGRVAAADEALASCALPPVTFDGADLMKVVGRRLGVRVPPVRVAGWPTSSSSEVIEWRALVHDSKRAAALALEPIFNPDLRRIAPTRALFDPTRAGPAGGLRVVSSDRATGLLKHRRLR